MKTIKKNFPALLILFLAQFALGQQRIDKPVIIAYAGGYKGLIDTSKMEPLKITHINYAFINIKDGKAFLENKKTDTVNFKNLNALKRINKDLKILISIGGWSWSENFSNAVLTDSSRRAFAKSAVDIVRGYKLDGVDIDWEYPGMAGEAGNLYRPEDKQNYTLMFAVLREELNMLEKQSAKKLLLTTATAGFASFLDNTEMAKAQQYLDYVNIMTYDFYSSKLAGHHTNLFSSSLNPSDNSADKAVKAYVAAGVPTNKLVMGIAFYGRNMKISGESKIGLGGKITSQTFGDGYSKIKDSLVNKNGFKEYRDEEAKAPYLYNDQSQLFITYDNEWSVKHKCDYVLEKGMAGVMFWEYDNDEKGYLLSEINKVLGK
ncbi:glycoside hydrolase family 18 protein [Desertivirga arenae]|uniref:glycoside hydrolase family 18 protein n=1 Tax=Desertivirga arenae TaxID=2810309 RepID=UPI001A95850B|nr:glycoside hydrolase family 18 protein [Pedobacter sp. SYSU D00823]